MREVSVFYAYDEREFFDREECLEYEKKGLAQLKILDVCYAFYDKGMNRFFPPCNEDIEDWMDWAGNAMDTAECIRITCTLPHEVAEFISENWGYCVLPEDFNYRIGLFKYNWIRDEWIKVDD